MAPTPARTSRSTDAVGLDLLERYFASRDRELRDACFHHYRGLARKLAGTMAGRGIPRDDLIQVADLSLLSAIGRYDPERSTNFTGFAASTILGDLKKLFRDQGWGVRVPRPMKELSVRVRSSADDLHARLGRSPTVAELAEEIDVAEELILRAIEAGAAYRSSTMATEEGAARAEEAGRPRHGGQEAAADERILASELLSTLPPRERRIVYLRYFEDMTQSEIAALVGLSQMHVSRLLRSAIEVMRAHAEPAQLAS